jgi:hypothetical protein
MPEESLADFEVTYRFTVRDIPVEVEIKCLWCDDYRTWAFWSLRDAERDFCQHFAAKHPK